MKANIFLKENGLKKCSRIVEDLIEQGNDGEFVKYLKRLVDSHELVSNFGGLKRAKRIIKKAYTSFNTMISVVWNDKQFQCTIQQLEQAIADVESCKSS